MFFSELTGNDDEFEATLVGKVKNKQMLNIEEKEQTMNNINLPEKKSKIKKNGCQLRI